jgi:DNA-directed RNA polymerase subunit RPC12/RpoP
MSKDEIVKGRNSACPYCAGKLLGRNRGEISDDSIIGTEQAAELGLTE